MGFHHTPCIRDFRVTSSRGIVNLLKDLAALILVILKVDLVCKYLFGLCK
jgi:hypothetical protein